MDESAILSDLLFHPEDIAVLRFVPVYASTATLWKNP